MGGTYTPKTSAIRDQLHGTLLRLGGSVTIQALDGIPLGVLPGTRGDVVLDTRNGQLWLKTTGEPNGAPSTDGWVILAEGAGTSNPREFASINWDAPPPVAQTGSEAAFVNTLGPGGLSTPAPGFQSPAANSFRYVGAGGTFFAQSQIGLQPQEATSVQIRYRVAVNGVPVPGSESYLIRASVQGFLTATSAQVSLVLGDVVSFQIHNAGGGLPLAAWSYGAQIWRVD